MVSPHLGREVKRQSGLEGTGDIEEEVCQVCDEGREPVEATRPFRPSRAEVDRHCLTHIPFRNWCEVCVRGKAKSDPHKKSVEERERFQW